MRDDRDYKVELSMARKGVATTQAAGRPFISVLFACCGVYLRVYRNGEGTKYVGRCPRCGKAVSFVVGEGGTACRVFRVE